jgi:cytochrome P450
MTSTENSLSLAGLVDRARGGFDLRPAFRGYKAYRRVRARARDKGLALPPGPFNPFDTRYLRDHRRLLDLAAQYGPIFGLAINRRFHVCIADLALARRFLAQNEANLNAPTIDLDRLFPGFINTVQHDAHRQCRHAIMHAMDKALPGHYDKAFGDFLDTELLRFAARPDGATGEALKRLTLRLSFAILVRLHFGIGPDEPAHAKLFDAYRRLGPDHLVWDIGPQQVAAYAQLKALVERQAAWLEDQGGNAPPCYLKNHVAAGALDDAMIGNLIYIVEMGRFDLASLFRWLVKYLSDHPDITKHLGEQTQTAAASGTKLDEAVVMETLRLSQAEEMYRRAEQDLAFDDYLIPKSTRIRICLWEAHKNPDHFPDPFSFRPERFMARKFSADLYAPFGIGTRRCLAAELVMRYGTMFTDRLVRGFRWDKIDDGPEVMGAFVRETNPKLAIRLKPRP